MTKDEYLKMAAAHWEGLQKLEEETNFYDYEKKFDHLMVDFGQQLLNKQMAGAGKDRRKKKVKTRYGQINVSKSHQFVSSVLNSSFSPYFRELLLFFGQEDNYAKSAESLKKLLRIPVHAMQIYREVVQGAEVVSDLAVQPTGKVDLLSEERVYAMLDGGMVLTRPAEWKEVKVGRVFKETSVHQLSEKRKEIRASEYVAHLGGHKDFEAKMSVLTDKYESLGSKLVFINDGAKWIWNWIEAEYPKATQILDYYHAKEHLGTFARFYFRDPVEREQWIKRTGDLLKKEGAIPVIELVKKMKKKTKTIEQEKHKLLNYYTNNRERMNYPNFLNLGLLIGSGAIEAAHRTITQKRLKQSGQRWSQDGAQNVLNLRVIYKSNRWSEIQELMKAA